MATSYTIEVFATATNLQASALRYAVVIYYLISIVNSRIKVKLLTSGLYSSPVSAGEDVPDVPGQRGVEPLSRLLRVDVELLPAGTVGRVARSPRSFRAERTVDIL